MIKLNKRITTVTVIGMVIMASFTGCRPYDKPEFVKIEPSQTAFLIPLVGDTTKQGSFDSEELLNKTKVATKEIQIPKRWVQTGRMEDDGEYRKSADLIIVERKPETREWTADEKSGTSNKNQGIRAETQESIAFGATMNCSAQIDEIDAVKFLYRYNNKPLAEIMDSEIRNRITGKFVEQCAKYKLSELLLNKEAIMKSVRDDVVPYFKDRGITITTIALNGDLTYDNKEIQKSIDDKFKSSQLLETQKNENERNVSKAKADAEAIRIQADTLKDSIRLKEIEVQMKTAEKWNGVLPSVQGGNSGMMINIPEIKK